MRRAIFQGREVWVDNHGQIIGISQGMHGAEPGLSDARMADILSRLPDADIVGLQGHGVVPGGEQHSGGRRVLSETAGLPAAGETFRPLAGAQVNNRGNIATVTLPTFAGGPDQAIPSIVETAKSGGQDGEVIMIQLGMDLPPQLTDISPGSVYPGTLVEVTAIVEWGVGNAFFSAEMDWNQGTSFAIAASFIRISARVSRVLPLLVPDIDIVLRASLAYGNAVSLGISSPARRTLLMVPPPPSAGVLGPGATSAVFPIPLWAMGFTLIDAGGVGGAGAVVPDYTITCSEDGATASAYFKLTSRSNIATQVEGQFPIPSKSRFIYVTNNLGIGVIKPKMIFNLSF